MHDKNTGMDAVSHNADHAAGKAAMQECARMPLQCGLYAISYDRTTDGAECGSRGVSAQKKAGLVRLITALPAMHKFMRAVFRFKRKKTPTSTHW